MCKTGEGIKAKQSSDVQERVAFVELDATKPDWPVEDGAYEIVLMSYISGSVPAEIIGALYKNAYTALKPGGRLLVHDFMVNDSLDSPALGALWALQHVTVNADGLGTSRPNLHHPARPHRPWACSGSRRIPLPALSEPKPNVRVV